MTCTHMLEKRGSTPLCRMGTKKTYAPPIPTPTNRGPKWRKTTDSPFSDPTTHSNYMIHVIATIIRQKIHTGCKKIHNTKTFALPAQTLQMKTKILSTTCAGKADGSVKELPPHREWRGPMSCSSSASNSGNTHTTQSAHERAGDYLQGDQISLGRGVRGVVRSERYLQYCQSDNS